MRTFLFTFMVLGYILIIVHFGFGFNASVPIINSKLLTFIEVLFAICLVTFFLVKEKSSEEEKIKYFNKDFPILMKIKNYFVYYAVITIASIFSLTYINIEYGSETFDRQGYKVSEKGKHYIKYMDFPYILLERDSSIILFSTNELSKYKINQEVYLDIKEGFLGFSYVDRISN